VDDLTAAADTIRRHALAQRDICRAPGGSDLVADCWAALADAARELAPDLHHSIKRGTA